MASSAASPGTTTAGAFELDYNILTLLLKTQRLSHGRTKYFQRLEMAMKHLRKKTPLSFSKRLQDFLETQQEKDRKWVTGVDSELSYLQSYIRDTIPEALSRIIHAASALFIELGQGFFLPFCTVALSALGRLRIILQQWAVEGIHLIPDESERNELIREHYSSKMLDDNRFSEDGEVHSSADKPPKKEQNAISSWLSDIVGTEDTSSSNQREIDTEETGDRDSSTLNPVDAGTADGKAKATAAGADAEDVGTSVAHHFAEGTSAPVVDFNTEILKKHNNSSSSKQSSGKRKSKTDKKASKKKKKKKNVIDDIFGAL